MGTDTEPDSLDIPAFLKRDASNTAEFMRMSEAVEATESRPAKSKVKAKANGHDKAPVKAAGKPAAKAAPKAATKAKTAPKVTAKAAKAPEKVKAAKPAKAKAVSKAEKDEFGLRKGSTKSQAAAMYARKSGATLDEVKQKLGSVQLNVLNGLEEDGFTVERIKEERKGQRPVTRYYLKPKK